MMKSDRGITLIPLSGSKSIWIDPNQMRCKVLSEDELGAYSLFEIAVPPQAGLPKRRHHWEEGAYYILEGEVLIQKGNRTFTATAGSFIDIFQGMLHAFKNVGKVPARLLLIITPASYGKFFEEWARQRQKNSLRRLQVVNKTAES